MQTSELLRENIAKCLQDKHMTQFELAIQSGIHESTISRILSGKRDGFFYFPSTHVHVTTCIFVCKSLTYASFCHFFHKNTTKRGLPLGSPLICSYVES